MDLGQLTLAEITKILEALDSGLTEVKVTNEAASPVNVVLDAAMVTKINELHAALVVDKDAGFQLTGSSVEQASAQDTQVATTVVNYNRAAGATQMEVYCESGYVRVRTDGVVCTDITGEPLAPGFGAGWAVESISVYYIQESVITVVSR